MKLRPASLLRLPSGSAALFLNEARTQQLLVQDINTLYDSWGYLPVHTPLVDFSRAYEGLVPEADLKRVYHLVDRDGEILMLRWDITLFLIKQVRSLLQDATLPLRLCYSDSILRHQEAEDISRNEFFQSGAELIGLEGPDGDMEVLLLLHAAMKKLGLAPAVHLGSRQLFESAFASFSQPGREAMALAIVNRDRQAKNDIWAEQQGLAQSQIEAIDKLFTLIAAPAAARDALKDISAKLPMNVALEAGKLVDFANRVQALEPELLLRVDLSELGSQHYHSGIVFQAYLDGMDSHIAAGGRYDNLLARLGSPAPAVGFSIMLSKLTGLAHLNDPDGAQLLSLSDNKHAGHRDSGSKDSGGSNFESRYDQAAKLRLSGKRVAL